MGGTWTRYVGLVPIPEAGARDCDVMKIVAWEPQHAFWKDTVCVPWWSRHVSHFPAVHSQAHGY